MERVSCHLNHVALSLVPMHLGNRLGGIGALERCFMGVKDCQYERLGLGNRGLAKAKKGDLEGAIADLDQAIQLNPELADAYLNRVFFSDLTREPLQYLIHSLFSFHL